MKYARAAWRQERNSWRAVIQLNLIRSIITIVETIQAEMDNPQEIDSAIWSSADSNASHGSDSTQPLSVMLTNKHQILKRRLGPLRRVEEDLKKRLGAGTEEIVSGGVGIGNSGERIFRSTEFAVRGLKDALGVWTEKETVDGEQQTDEATEVIVSCKDDMNALWTDEAVRAVLMKRRMRIENSAGLLVNFCLGSGVRSVLLTVLA